MAEPYLIQMAEEGKDNSGRLTERTLEEIFGRAVAIAPKEKALQENDSLIGQITLKDTVIAAAPEGEGRYTVEGKLALPEGWEEYQSFLTGLSDFSGTASLVKMEQGYAIGFSLEAPLPRPFPFLKAEFERRGVRQIPHRYLGNNSLVLTVSGRWQGKDGETQDSGAYAEFVCQVKLDVIGEVSVRHRLFQGNAWEFEAAFSPALTLSGVAKFIGELVGAPEAVSSIVLPEGLPGLDFLAVSRLRFSLSQQMNVQGIEVILASALPWSPSVPFFQVEELGVSLYFGIPSQERMGPDVTVSCGILGGFLIRPKDNLRLRLDMWCDFPGLTASGALLAVQEQEETDIRLSELLGAYGVPSADIGGLTVADIRYIASVPERSFFLEFEINTGEILSFSILGLPISITEISGEFSYDPEALSLSLGGQIQVGRTDPFVLGVQFDYDCKEESGWHFLAELTAGEASIASVLTELFGLNGFNARLSEPLFDLKLTDFRAEFYSDSRGPFSVRAMLEQPWSTRLLGVNLALFGSVDLIKETTGDTAGTLMAGFRLNAFQMRVFYELVQEENYRFQIWYEDAYLEASYVKRDVHELLVLGLKGMTLYGLVSGFVHIVNPNADYKLSPPWDILDRIRLDDFSLEFDMAERTVTMLYDLDLNIAGLVQIRRIGIRYSRKETSKVEFVLTGSFLEQEYTAENPLTWDAVNDNPPDVGGTDAKIIRISYLGMGQHFGTEELLLAKDIAGAVEALKNAIQPVKAGERPRISYSEEVDWLFGADMTYRGMLRVQMVLNDPSLYGVLITVKEGEDNALSSLAGLSLQLLYRKITDDIGMFSAELTVPDRFRTLRLGALQLTLGRFYMELYTNGGFYLDLGFPKQQDFSESFVIEAGIYTGRGGFYFGVLSQETSAQVPVIVNGRFDPVITVGVGISIGIGRSFDFSVVKGAASLEFFAIFEGVFAVYTPADAGQSKDFYYAAEAVAGIYGRLFLTVDFVVLSVSANAEIKAYVSAALEAYRPILFGLDLELKVGASIRILFIKVSFSFHFSMHMDFSIGEASKTPWKLAGPGRRRQVTGGYCPRRMHGFVENAGVRRPLCVRREFLRSREKTEISVRILPLYTVLQPSLEPCAAFLLLTDQNEKGFGQILKIAEEWVTAHLEEREVIGTLERLTEQLREEAEDFAAYFKERTRLVFQPVPSYMEVCEERSGVFFPAVPGLILDWQTFGQDGEIIDRDTVSFAEEPMVDETYIEMLKEYFARLNPEPEKYAGKEYGLSGGKDRTGQILLPQVLLEDYLSVILQAVTGEVRRHARGVRLKTEGKTLRELAESFPDIRVPFQKRHGENWESMADTLGMAADALRSRNMLPENMEDGEYREISVGVTPHSILLDNPSWKFAADTITVEGKRYRTAGSSVEQVLHQNRIPLDALVRAVQDEPGVFSDDVITVRNVPLLEKEEICGILRSDETMQQAAGMVSRLFLQGLRLPRPSAGRNAVSLSEPENWAGLYEILGQQKHLYYESGAETDFMRHRLTVSAAPDYGEWLQVGDDFEIVISNEEILENAPSEKFVPVYEQPLQETAPFITEKRKHPFEEYRLYVDGDKRKSILTFTKDFIHTMAGHGTDYIWKADSMLSGLGRTMGQNADTLKREGSFGLLIPITLKTTENADSVYEITVADKGSSYSLYSLKRASVTDLALLWEPSAVENMEEGLYRLPLEKEQTRLVMTDLSRETKSSLYGASQSAPVYTASMADSVAFLKLLWQLSVTNVRGCYLCLEEEGLIKSDLFSSSGEGKLWLLVAAESGEDGCNCVIDNREIYANEYAWLEVKAEKASEHPEEYMVKSVLEPGSAGFSVSLAQPENPEEDKADKVRSLYSMINYQICGEGYEECRIGLPLLPKEPENGAAAWEYSQSVPLDRFLLNGRGNPYDNAGMPAQVELEFRDILGNAAAGCDGEYCCNVTITPQYSDALLALHQTGVISAGYRAENGDFVLSIKPSLEEIMGARKCQEVLSYLEKAVHQIQAEGVTVSLETALLQERIGLPCGDILDLYRQVQKWLLWAESLEPAGCGSDTLSGAVRDYVLTPEELLGGNLDADLSELFPEQQLEIPVTKIFFSGDTLAGLFPEEDWRKNPHVPLHSGTDVIVSGSSGRSYRAAPGETTFALAAASAGCRTDSLVEDNRNREGILSLQYVFTFQGYEIEVGSRDGVTASLDDVCAAFLQFFDVNVTPMELVAEETEGILSEGAQLVFRRLTVGEGETLSENHLGCTPEELWNYNRDTKDFLENGTAVWCSTRSIAAEQAGSLDSLCDVYGITLRQFYEANSEAYMSRPEQLDLPFHIAFPREAFEYSFTLPENEGNGYSLTWICENYNCENGLWFYCQMQDILIEGRQIQTEGGTVAVSRFDTIESLKRKLTALGAAEDLLFGAVIIRDGITLPRIPQGKEYRERIDGAWIGKQKDTLLKLEAKLHIYRPSDGKSDVPEEIYHAWTPVLPENNSGESYLENFAAGLEETLPFVHVLLGEAEQEENTLYLWIVSGKDGEGMGSVRFAPFCCYDRAIKTPAFYALAPITTNLVSRENVPVASLKPDGTLGESEMQSFAGVDVELWAAVFLQDIENMFSPQMLEKTFRNNCGALAEHLLMEKELLAVKISGRLRHILQPLNRETDEDIRQAREAFTEKLRSSLTYACRKNVLLQYPGTVEMQTRPEADCHLAGSLNLDEFTEPVQLQAGKINLTDKESRLHIFAEADRLRNASFLLKEIRYQIRELEWISGQEGEDCRQSRWFSFLRPPGETYPAENIEIDLSCGLAVPSPLRVYPSQPVLKSHNITSKRPEEIGDVSELLRYDYHVTISHEMKGQDMIYLTVVFNESPESVRSNVTKDVFDCLAQYNSVRNSLLSFLQGDREGFEQAYETMVSLAQETVEQWDHFAEPQLLRDLEEKTYDCRFRVWTQESELRLELYTEEQMLPAISYIPPEGGEQKFVSKKTEEGGRYRLAGFDEEQISGQITLELTLENLDIMKYQSVYARSRAARNEDLSDTSHPVNKCFLYSTEETAFTCPLNALVNCGSDLPVFIPADYLKENEFEERAVCYLFDEVLKTGQYDAQLACHISYGYRIGGNTETCVELPVCMQPRTAYSDAWRAGLTEYILKWKEQHSLPSCGRYLRFGITVFSTELQEEGIPVVKFEGIRLKEGL